MKQQKTSESGQAIVLIAVALVALIAIVGLAVDGGMAYSDRQQAQNAADAAVMSAALARAGGGGNYSTAALTMAATNGYDNDGQKSIVDVHLPPISGPYAGNNQYIQVVITSRVRTFFAGLIGRSQITNTVEAVARAKPAEWKEMLNGHAIVSLAPHSDCQNTKAFWVHGEATLELQGGGIWINSDNRACAFMQQGNGSVAITDDSMFYIVGGASLHKPYLIKRQSPGIGYMVRKEESIALQPIVGAVPLPYPPPFVMPKVSCGTSVATVNGDTMSPGFWDPTNEEPTFPPKGVKNLKRGIYCIGGDVRVHGNTELHGTGVLLIVDGSVHFAGDATINLEALGGGPFQGLLLYLPLGNRNTVVLNGDSESTFRGSILAPSSLIRINGNHSNYGFHSQIIGLFIEVNGSSNVLINYKDEQNYDAASFPSVEFIQ
ncbi:MAG: hypothetical protein HY867_20910 [Chloroflexi bacterium]|nr:hypothetical protein [Chloroflexota bacterium]